MVFLQEYIISSHFSSDNCDQVYTFSEAITRRFSIKNVFLKNLQKSWENSCVVESLFNKVAGLQPTVQVFSGEFCGIYRKTFFIKHLRTAASVNVYKPVVFIPTSMYKSKLLLSNSLEQPLHRVISQLLFSNSCCCVSSPD